MENRFTGWTDVDLSEKGVAEAKEASRLLGDGGYEFDLAFTSVLKRAVRTLDIVLHKLDMLRIPVVKNWRLNERHYGALQGLDKAETAAKHGEEQVHAWRRSFDIRPPALDPGDTRNPALDRRYAGIDPDTLPLTESLEDTINRVLPYWNDVILKDILAGKRIIVSAHGNSLRALVKYLDGISDSDIASLNIPTGIPLVYELDPGLKPVRHYYLGDPAAAEAAARKVADQGKA